MSDDQLDDLKQFILATVSQSESRLTTMFTEKIDALEKKMDDGFAGVGDAITAIHERDDGIEQRLTNLEHVT